MFTKNEVQSLLNCQEIIKAYPTTGQKQVFLIKDTSNKVVIAKFVKDNDLRVQREIEIVTNNKIFNVPKIEEIKHMTVNENEQYICIIEEYIEGDTLKKRIENNKLSTVDGLKLMETLLVIATQLERISVVHRDIKPDNIICSSNGKYYLIDFGIARQLDNISLTMTQVAVGPHTPGYGAPELFQYSKKSIDIRADLFSIGVVLFEALTGEHPFITGSELDVNEIWYRTKTVVPRNMTIQGDKESQLISFIQTLMQKHPTRRPPNAQKALALYKAILPTIDV